LSDQDIYHERKRGNISIWPFSRKNLRNNAYNVTIGENYYRSTGDLELLNPWNKKHVLSYWEGPYKAQPVDADIERQTGIQKGHEVIIVSPGDTILCHTQEFIGGLNMISTMLKARDSITRCGVHICHDGGWGDIGYINRWILTVENRGKVPVAIPVGSRIGQIVFFYSGDPKFIYRGKKQSTEFVQRMVDSWDPSLMLPPRPPSPLSEPDKSREDSNLLPRQLADFTDHQYHLRASTLQDHLDEDSDSSVGDSETELEQWVQTSKETHPQTKHKNIHSKHPNPAPKNKGTSPKNKGTSPKDKGTSPKDKSILRKDNHLSLKKNNSSTKDNRSSLDNRPSHRNSKSLTKNNRPSRTNKISTKDNRSSLKEDKSPSNVNDIPLQEPHSPVKDDHPSPKDIQTSPKDKEFLIDEGHSLPKEDKSSSKEDSSLSGGGDEPSCSFSSPEQETDHHHLPTEIGSLD
jgi:deoxycytidine triphosphate deaminase